ncbi:hypothetical protein GGC47_005309 [Bosea sp. OAE752]|uniref:MFS transporter n=1 Tax=Bosea sp. OAE752 TaxID=2663873 RepID=UPI003D23C11F
MSSLSVKLPFFGWYTVAATFVLAIFGWGVGFYGPPIYLQVVVERTGWSVALVSAAVTLHFLIGAVVIANLPRLYRRLGVPVVTSLGAALLAAGVLGWAIAGEPWQLFSAALLSGVGWVAMGAAAVNAIISPWFVSSRPAALSMAYNGASIGGVIFSPLWVALILAIGFLKAAIVVGTVMAVAIFTLSIFVFSKSPAQLNQFPDGIRPSEVPAAVPPSAAAALPKGSLWRDRRFLTLAAGMAFGLFAQIGLLAHLFSLLVPAIGPQNAGLAMGGATVAAIVGRTVVGLVMPASADRRLVACASYAVQIGGSLTFLIAGDANVTLMIIGVVLFGAGIGNATSLPPLIAQAEFAKADVARVVPLIVAIGQASYSFAPAAFGALRTMSPSGTSDFDGTMLFAAASVVQGAAIASFLLGRQTR